MLIKNLQHDRCKLFKTLARKYLKPKKCMAIYPSTYKIASERLFQTIWFCWSDRFHRHWKDIWMSMECSEEIRIKKVGLFGTVVFPLSQKFWNFYWWLVLARWEWCTDKGSEKSKEADVLWGLCTAGLLHWLWCHSPQDSSPSVRPK